MKNLELSAETLQGLISLDGDSEDFPHEVIERLSHARIIVVGEMHGSSEPPAFVANLVTQLCKGGTRFTVGLEMHSQNQSGLDAYVTTLDENAFLSIPHFATPSDDGRSSIAMAGLVQKLASNRNVRFCAFDADVSTWSTADDQGRDSAMAENLSRFMLQYPGERVVILCGNVHSAKVVGSPFDANFRSMILELCQKNRSSIKLEDVYSIFVDFENGQTWTKATKSSIPPTTWDSNDSCLSAKTNLQRCFVPCEREKFYGHDAVLFIRTLSASPPFRLFRDRL